MPIDYSLLLENICDPDHGIFAHQTKSFDMYTASPEFALNVRKMNRTEDRGDFVLQGEVPAVYKQMKAPTKEEEPPMATTTFYPPCHVQLSRRRKDGSTNFVIAFWIV